MIKELQKGNTFLIKGPTRVSLESGKIEVFGTMISPDKKSTDSEFDVGSALIIPGANVYPVYALEKSKLDIYTATEENIISIKGNSIPNEWIKVKDSLIGAIKKNKGKPPIKIMVLGLSSGKTTLIKYLANSFFAEGFKGGYLDSDLGQQIIFLPTTLNIGKIKTPIISNDDIKSEKSAFIGSTFPKGNYKFIISHTCNDLINDFYDINKDIEYFLIDTDGWCKTEAGVVYKNFFIKTVDPDILIIFNDETIEELGIIREAASKKETREIILLNEKNDYYYEKDKDERRFLRQSQFARILEEFRKITIPLDDIIFVKRDYNKEMNIVEEIELNLEQNLINLPYHYVIIAMLDENSKLIDIGLLFTINMEKDYILLFSNLKYTQQIKIKKILLGSLRLSTKGNHQGYLYL